MDPSTPDWESMADVNFLIRRRLIEHLNAAIGAVNLVDTPEAGSKPAEFWKTHAIRQIMRAQHLYEAWNTLMQYKAGQRLTQQHPFRAGDLLEWLSSETFQTYIPHTDHEEILVGNRETLQEALLLVHSAAYSLGPNVRLVTDMRGSNFWFRIQYQDLKHKTHSFADLMETLGDQWRTANASFELSRAQDFLEMNGCALQYSWKDGVSELGFFVASINAARQGTPAASTQTEDETLASLPDADETHASAEDIRSRFSRRVQSNQSSVAKSSAADK